MKFSFFDINYKPIGESNYYSDKVPIPRVGEYVKLISGKDVGLTVVRQVSYDFRNNEACIVLNIDNSKTFKWTIY